MSYPTKYQGFSTPQIQDGNTTAALAVMIITRSDGRTSSGFKWAITPVENFGTLKIAKPYAILFYSISFF